MKVITSYGMLGTAIVCMQASWPLMKTGVLYSRPLEGGFLGPLQGMIWLQLWLIHRSALLLSSTTAVE